MYRKWRNLHLIISDQHKFVPNKYQCPNNQHLYLIKLCATQQRCLFQVNPLWRTPDYSSYRCLASTGSGIHIWPTPRLQIIRIRWWSHSEVCTDRHPIVRQVHLVWVKELFAHAVTVFRCECLQCIITQLIKTATKALNGLLLLSEKFWLIDSWFLWVHEGFSTQQSCSIKLGLRG